jgi:hypothetical protein
MLPHLLICRAQRITVYYMFKRGKPFNLNMFLHCKKMNTEKIYFDTMNVDDIPPIGLSGETVATSPRLAITGQVVLPIKAYRVVKTRNFYKDNDFASYYERQKLHRESCPIKIQIDPITQMKSRSCPNIFYSPVQLCPNKPSINFNFLELLLSK